MPIFKKELTSLGIFTGLFRSRDKPTNRAAGFGYSFFFGGTTPGKAVNEMSAMQMTAVYSCVRILAEVVARLASYHLLSLYLLRKKHFAVIKGRDTQNFLNTSAKAEELL